MRKRLRKKLHRKEYAIHGVSLRIFFTHELDPSEFDQFIDDFLEEVMDSRGLSFGGGGHPVTGLKGVIEPKRGDSSISEDELVQVRAWLRDRREIQSFEISESWDIYNGSNPHDKNQESEAQQVASSNH